MTAPLPDRQRHVVPRWRSPDESVRAGELTTPRPSVRKEQLEHQALIRKRAFQQASGSGEPAIEEALELYVAAVAASDSALEEEAATYLLEHEQVSESLRTAVSRFGDRERASPPLGASSVVALARLRIRDEPRDVLAWTELARGRLLMGNESEAAKALRVARQLAPTNRYVTRASARLFVHRHEPDRAHQLVVSHPRLRSDPWLQATEIACAQMAEESPRMVGAARSAVLWDDRDPKEVSELAAALATLEFSAGSEGRARDFIGRAVAGEHDNALAQAQDLHRRGLRVPSKRLEAAVLTHPLGFEARAQRAYADGAWSVAWQSGNEWMSDQAFSSMPARFLSLVAIVGLADPEQSLQVAERGLEANPEHLILINNAAFAQLVLGDLANATAALNRAGPLAASAPAAERAALTATHGLLAYRIGHVDAGDLLYRRARDIGRESGSLRVSLAVDAFHYWIRQELGLDRGRTPQVQLAREPALTAMMERVEEGSLKLQPVQHLPEQSVHMVEAIAGHLG